jgi:fumarate reductase subunit D
MDNQNQQPPLKATPVTSFDPKDVQENQLMAVLSYIGILCLIPLLMKKTSKFAQEHAKQGFVLFLFEIAASVVGMLPALGIIGSIASVAGLIVSVIGIINVMQGKFWEIPVIGQYRNKVNF